MRRFGVIAIIGFVGLGMANLASAEGGKNERREALLQTMTSIPGLSNIAVLAIARYSESTSDQSCFDIGAFDAQAAELVVLVDAFVGAYRDSLDKELIGLNRSLGSAFGDHELRGFCGAKGKALQKGDKASAQLYMDTFFDALIPLREALIAAPGK